jgi:hypothetical protein
MINYFYKLYGRVCCCVKASCLDIVDQIDVELFLAPVIGRLSLF